MSIPRTSDLNTQVRPQPSIASSPPPPLSPSPISASSSSSLPPSLPHSPLVLPQARTSFRRSSRNARGSVSEVGRRSEAGRLQFTRTQDDTNLPSAAKKDMADYLVKLEKQFTITPQRMRMSVLASSPFPSAPNSPHRPSVSPSLCRIVDSFIDVLDRGLAEKGNEVVRPPSSSCAPDLSRPHPRLMR